MFEFQTLSADSPQLVARIEAFIIFKKIIAKDILYLFFLSPPPPHFSFVAFGSKSSSDISLWETCGELSTFGVLKDVINVSISNKLFSSRLKSAILVSPFNFGKLKSKFLGFHSTIIPCFFFFLEKF